MKAVLFDLDGVIRHRDPDVIRGLEERAGLPAGALLGAALEPSLLDRVVLGQIDDGAWREEVARIIAAAHGPAAAVAIDPWREIVGWADPDMVGLAAELRAAGRPIALVTNATTRLEEELELLGIGGAFDAVINSARVGLAKPDPRIFQLAAAKIGCAPADCVFVDDTPGHVEAARALGMTAFHFAGPADLRARLAELGLL